MNAFTIEIGLLAIIVVTLFMIIIYGITYTRRILQLFEYRNSKEEELNFRTLDIKKEELYIKQQEQKLKIQELERQERYGPKMNEELLYRIQDSIRYAFEKEFRSNASSINSEISSLKNIISKYNNDVIINIENRENLIKPTSNEGIERKQLIKELSHSLNTPISLMELTISNLKSLDSIKEDSQLSSSLESIDSSIKICKSILSSYREITLLAESTDYWNPDSINDAIKSAFEVYKSKSKKNTNLIIEMPDKIEGFSNNYIVSLVLPLLENAIESSKNNKAIEIKFTKKEESINSIEIINEPEDIPKTDKIYESGFTTKKNHDGLGLSVVKSLLSTYSGSGISNSSKNGKVSFEIKLKGRKI